MRICGFYFVIVGFLMSCNENNNQYAKPSQSSKIIETQEAHSYLNDSLKIFIHIGKEESYKLDHIPNAIQLWRPDYATKEKMEFGGMRASRSEIQSLLQSIGFENGKELIIYDSKGNVDALRFAWVLECYGFQDYRIIDGGLVNWKLNSYLTTKDIPASPQATAYKLSSINNVNIVADFNDVQLAMKDTNTIIVDTREPYEYNAKPFVLHQVLYSHKKGSFARGCIPGAIHLNWSDLVDLKTDHKIKSTDVIDYNLKQKGINSDKRVIVYCQSGSRSSHTAFVLKEIMGYPSVKNYDGSWIEWSYRNKYLRDAEIQLNTTEEEFRALFSELASQLKNQN